MMPSFWKWQTRAASSHTASGGGPERGEPRGPRQDQHGEGVSSGRAGVPGLWHGPGTARTVTRQVGPPAMTRGAGGSGPVSTSVGQPPNAGVSHPPAPLNSTGNGAAGMHLPQRVPSGFTPSALTPPAPHMPTGGEQRAGGSFFDMPDSGGVSGSGQEGASGAADNPVPAVAPDLRRSSLFCRPWQFSPDGRPVSGPVFTHSGPGGSFFQWDRISRVSSAMQKPPAGTGERTPAGAARGSGIDHR
jgi:hypothetical protein